MSLEEIFFAADWRGRALYNGNQFTRGAIQVKNAWIICRKELHSYFVSPVAYLLLTMFALLFGFFFWNMLGSFVIAGMEAQAAGETFPMNLNEQVIRPLLSNISVIGLFFIPMITMRLFAEEKRTGTIELLATSPIQDIEIILGKWFAAVLLYACMMLLVSLNFVFLFRYGNPDWKPLAIGYLGLLLQAGGLLATAVRLSPRSREIKSSPEPRRSAFVCSYGFWGGSANTRPPRGPRCFPTCR